MQKKNITGDPKNYITTLEMKSLMPAGFDFSCFQKYKMRGSRKTYYLKKEVSDMLSLLNDKKAEEEISPEPMTLIAYVDGSFNKNTGVYGSGIVLLCDNEVIATKRTMGTKMNSMWNVAGEIAAAATAVKMAEELMPDHLIIRYDCEAIEMWPTGKWKVKEGNEFAAKYVAYMNKKREFDISYEHVKAHTGDVYNEMADDLALTAAGLKTMQQSVPKYEHKDEKIPDDILRIKYQVSNTCIEGIKGFYEKEKHAFKDYAKLRTGRSDNFSQMWKEENFINIISKNAIEYIKELLSEHNDRMSAMRWTARGLDPDDAVRKTKVDNELFTR